jgi:hypothetical protein
MVVMLVALLVYTYAGGRNREAAAARRPALSVDPTAPPVAARPPAPGPPAPGVVVAEYDLGDTAFTDPEDWPGGSSELKAVVHYPRKLPPGRLPLIVALHGNWVWCAADETLPWPCPDGVPSIPSYRGYDYLGDALALRGFVVVSLSGNGINAGLGVAEQRTRLINQHLAMWQQYAATGDGPLAGAFTDPATGRKAPVDLRGRIDMLRVGTLGHSVGGQAVLWHASDQHRVDWPKGVEVKAVLTMAAPYPGFDNDNGETRPDSTSFAVLSAQCWGAGDLKFVDDVRGRNSEPVYSMTLAGANHSFLNTNWSPSSGVFGAYDDSECPDDPAKLSEEPERAAAVAYATAYFARVLRGDTAADPILTGVQPLAPGVTGKAEFLPAAH